MPHAKLEVNPVRVPSRVRVRVHLQVYDRDAQHYRSHAALVANLPDLEAVDPFWQTVVRAVRRQVRAQLRAPEAMVG
ncbi:MAG: hypothetical protein QN178_14035 [Armatimonadota bacterium]|nr:hypothetical protein [Armatimonadota bacterium]